MTMDKTTMVSLLDGKIEEQRETIKALVAGKSPTTGEPISENTQHTQLNMQRNTLKNLHMIRDILSGEWTEEDQKYFTLITTLREEKEYNRAIVHRGDSVMELLMTNPKLTMEKVQKACSKAGLTIGADGIIR